MIFISIFIFIILGETFIIFPMVSIIGAAIMLDEPIIYLIATPILMIIAAHVVTLFGVKLS